MPTNATVVSKWFSNENFQSPGLEYLTTIDQLLVKQKVELLEAITGFETNNKFTIKNSLGQKVRQFIENSLYAHIDRFHHPICPRKIGVLGGGRK